MADPRTESRTEPATIRDRRPPGLAPEDDHGITTPGVDESRSYRINESEEAAFQSGRDTRIINADNADRDNPAQAATQDRTPPDRTTVSKSAAHSSPREWENGPSTTTDQASTGNADIPPLFADSEINDFRSRWNNVQAGFVDSPRQCVQEADELVADVLERLTSGFTQERTSLERQWDSNGNVSTEDLRVALQRYRSFFGRLLNAA
jgi:hypothetical protein